MPKKQKKFVFNDEKKKNSYGFRIPTKGIDTKRFKSNPVMLDSHWNSTRNVLGKWEEVEVKDGLLLGKPVFDGEDENAVYIQGKVERDFIKSCSMGVSFNREDLKIINGELYLTKCELMEVSIVAVPSNANAIRLYASDDTTKVLTEEEVQELCLSVNPIEIQPIEPEHKNKNMNKIKLNAATAAVLSLTVGAELSAEQLQERLCTVAAERDAANLQLSALKNAQEQAKLEAIQTKVDNAIKEGKVTAENKEDFVKLGISNPTLLDSTLAAIPGKKSLSAQVVPGGGDKPSEIKTADDFQKLSIDEQLKFKAENPEAYLKLFSN